MPNLRSLPAAFLAAALLASAVLRAQSASPAAAPPQATADSGQSETVKLSPFEVQADQSGSYSALNSNSITRFNTELNKLPVSADIFDQQFMQDVGARDVEDMIQSYDAGAGLSSPSPNASSNQSQPGDRSGAYITLRGLFSPLSQRDGFMPNNSTDSGYSSTFDVERVEVINGPQALLYGGGGGAGGVVNIVSKQARLGAPAQGSLSYYIDQFGTKDADFDYGVGTDNFAVRIALLQGTQKYRRQDLGGPMNGQYLQLAGKLGNTTVRVSSELQYWNRTLSQDPSLTSTGSSGGADRNGDNLQYLLATSQIGSVNPKTGAAYPSGAVDNGLLNWGNVDSYGTWLNNVVTTTRFSQAEIDSQWLPWLSTQVNVGYADQGSSKEGPGLSYYAPTAGGTTDPLNNIWNVGYTPSDSDNSSRTKGARFSVLAQNDLFGGRAKSTSILGIDYTRDDSALVAYGYFQADSDWNVLVNPASTSNQGRTALPKIFYPINQGVNQSQYAFFMPRANRITVGGLNYVRMVANPVTPALIGPSNPVGATVLGGSNYSLGHLTNHGIYGVNQTSWWDDRLDTIVGFRVGESVDDVNNQGYTPPLPPTTTKLSRSNTFSFNFGVNYKLSDWLRPYIEASDSFDPPLTQAQDPYGNNPPVAHGVGEEVGIKLINPSHTISGDLAIYHDQSKNEQYLITSSLMNDINPSGLNGTFGPRNQWVPTNRYSQGINAVVTAQPTPNWRVRFGAAFTDGKIQQTTTYGQVWNDSFNLNNSGQVTYSNGTPVYVNGTATSSGSATEVAPTAAGAVPLTLALLNNSSSPYYANPQSITGAIGGSSAPAKIFSKPLFPTQGSILTGITGIPVANAQINTASNPTITNYQAPVGTIPVTVAGQDTTGYPGLTFNTTAVYAFHGGALDGFSVGGTVRAAWKYSMYYYYTNGVGINNPMALMSFPNLTTFDGILSYRRKFGRIDWRVQMNVTNIFNHYDVIVTPDAVNGYNNQQNLNATWNTQPRYFTLTNTFTF